MLWFGLIWWMFCERAGCRKGLWWYDRLERCLHPPLANRAHKIRSLPYMWVSLFSRNQFTNQIQKINFISSLLCTCKNIWLQLVSVFQYRHNCNIGLWGCCIVALQAASLHICRHQTSLPAIRQSLSAPQWTDRLQKSFFIEFLFHLFKENLGMWQMQKNLVSLKHFLFWTGWKRLKFGSGAQRGKAGGAGGGCLNGQRKQEGTTLPYNSCHPNFRKPHRFTRSSSPSETEFKTLFKENI